MAAGRWVVIGGAALVAAAAVYLLFDLVVVSAVSALVASVVALAAYRYLERRNRRPVGTRPDPRGRLVKMLGSLVDLNILIRVESLGPEVVRRVENIIDKLRGLLEELNGRHPDHELTWTLNRMAGDYLPRVMEPYMALAERDRRASSGELLRSLDGLEGEIDNVADLVRGDSMGDFRAKAAFLRARFVQGARPGGPED